MPCTHCKQSKNIKNGIEPVGQRVIVPKGLVNPDRTTVIEIPANLQRSPAVIAERKEDSYATDQPVYSSTPRSSLDAPTTAPSPYSSVNTSASSKRPVRTRTIIETTRYTEDLPSDEEAPSSAPVARPIVDEQAKSFSRTGYSRMPYSREESGAYGGMGYGYTSQVQNHSASAVTSTSYGGMAPYPGGHNLQKELPSKNPNVRREHSPTLRTRSTESSNKCKCCHQKSHNRTANNNGVQQSQRPSSSAQPGLSEDSLKVYESARRRLVADIAKIGQL